MKNSHQKLAQKTVGNFTLSLVDDISKSLFCKGLPLGNFQAVHALGQLTLKPKPYMDLRGGQHTQKSLAILTLYINIYITTVLVVVIFYIFYHSHPSRLAVLPYASVQALTALVSYCALIVSRSVLLRPG